jgi:hypothetical protein
VDAHNAFVRLQEVFEAESLPDEQTKNFELDNALEVDGASFTWYAPPPEPDGAKGKGKGKDKNKKAKDPKKDKKGKKKSETDAEATVTPRLVPFLVLPEPLPPTSRRRCSRSRRLT